MKMHNRHAIRLLIEAGEGVIEGRRGTYTSITSIENLMRALQVAYNMGLGGELAKPQILKDIEAKNAHARAIYGR